MMIQKCCPTRLIIIIIPMVADVIWFGISPSCLLVLWFLTLSSILSTHDLYRNIIIHINIYSTTCFFLTHNFLSTFPACFYIYFQVCAISFQILHHQTFVKPCKLRNIELNISNLLLYILYLGWVKSCCFFGFRKYN
jgi:hypothetical protein